MLQTKSKSGGLHSLLALGSRFYLLFFLDGFYTCFATWSAFSKSPPKLSWQLLFLLPASLGLVTAAEINTSLGARNTKAHRSPWLRQEAGRAVAKGRQSRFPHLGHSSRLCLSTVDSPLEEKTYRTKAKGKGRATESLPWVQQTYRSAPSLRYHHRQPQPEQAAGREGAGDKGNAWTPALTAAV